MYKENFTLNNLQGLICCKTQPMLILVIIIKTVVTHYIGFKAALML